MKALLSGILLIIAASSSAVLAKDSDELWEIITQTTMPGMPMPEVKQTVCLPKGEGYKPMKVPHQKKCNMTDIKVSGNKTTWKVHCSGREAMEGSGETVRTAKTMKGSMNISSINIQMTQTFSGKRLGTCQAK